MDSAVGSGLNLATQAVLAHLAEHYIHTVVVSAQSMTSAGRRAPALAAAPPTPERRPRGVKFGWMCVALNNSSLPGLGALLGLAIEAVGPSSINKTIGFNTSFDGCPRCSRKK